MYHSRRKDDVDFDEEASAKVEGSHSVDSLNADIVLHTQISELTEEVRRR